MRAILLSLIFSLAQTSAFAQSQQAGADAGQADAAFQELISKCDNTDILFLRGKTRLLLGRTTPEAAEKAQGLLDEGMAKCGEGDIEAAKSKINEGFELAQTGVTERLGTDASAGKAEADSESNDASDGKSADKPWWKIW